MSSCLSSDRVYSRVNVGTEVTVLAMDRRADNAGGRRG
jgi:hypothetical protein